MPNTLDALNNGGKRVKTHDAQMVIKLPQSAKDLIKEAAAAQGVSDATVVRHALAEYLQRRGYKG